MQNSKNNNNLYIESKRYYTNSTRMLCRCVIDFNNVYKFPLFVVFAWDMVGLASILATFQFQLVEYSIMKFDMYFLGAIFD